MIGPHSELVEQWIEKANHDYCAAVQLLRSDDHDTPYDVICFHAQQAAEKYCKATCVENQKSVPRTHDLLELLPLLPESIRSCLSPDEMAELNPFAVEVRYPGVAEQVTREDAEHALDICGRVRSACLRYLSEHAS